MNIRLFRCGHCGHALRFGTGYCSVCHAPAPLFNRPSTYAAIAGALALTIWLSQGGSPE